MELRGEYIPSLHMCLAVLLGLRIVELQSLEAGASHKEERYVLDIVDILLIRVLHIMLV